MDLYELENPSKGNTTTQDTFQALQAVNTEKSTATPTNITAIVAHPNRNEPRIANSVSFADKVGVKRGLETSTTWEGILHDTDLRNILGGGPWRFGDQILHLSKWTLDFDPAIQCSSTAFAWIKFPKLGQQYWDYEILMSMGRALGSPVGVDK
ncbi:hypothetical protein IFM89_020316 [Coptis chinensis]|uniref:DUF4283 domain-containing protein n=1 Tax=Coptis chinensis TaxID=261450 RepID=A0A835HMC6_9MAGN|nr:hypothetical protein IFM89_020316 [Coptis chinensis]